MEKTINCLDCGQPYTYDEKAGYPRKYCQNCSVKRKAKFEAEAKGYIAPNIANEGVAQAAAIKANKPTSQNLSSNASFYAAYAKDIFNSIIVNSTHEVKQENYKELMHECCQLVNHAREYFE